MTKKLRIIGYLTAAVMLSSCGNESSSENETVVDDPSVEKVTPVEDTKTVITTISSSKLLECLKAYVGIDKGFYAAVYGDQMILGFKSALKNPNLGELIGNGIREAGESDKTLSVYSERLKEFDELLSNSAELKNAFMHDTGILYSCDEMFSQ